MRLQKVKLGRPFDDGEAVSKRKVILVKLDAVALEALEVIEADLKHRGVSRARSSAVRGALIDAAERILQHRKK
jgi:hypothetical protein